MRTKLYKTDYELLKKLSLASGWENTTDVETLVDIAKILHDFSWFKTADDVITFLREPSKKLFRHNMYADEIIKEIITEYEEELEYAKTKNIQA